MRKLSRSPLFHSAKISAISPARFAQAVAQQLVGLADELHVGVLDAVVHHLHEMPCAVRADVGAARHAVDVRGDLLKQGAKRLVGLRRAARHDRRAVQRALFAARDARADEVQTAFPHRFLTTNRVGVQRISAVDDDVALFHGIGELGDDGVGRLARLDHDQHAARLLQCGKEFRNGLASHELAFRSVIGEQCVGLGDRSVVQGHGVPVMGEIASDVRPHHGQARHADLSGAIGSGGFRRGHSDAFRCFVVAHGFSTQIFAMR